MNSLFKVLFFIFLLLSFSKVEKHTSTTILKRKVSTALTTPNTTSFQIDGRSSFLRLSVKESLKDFYTLWIKPLLEKHQVLSLNAFTPWVTHKYFLNLQASHGRDPPSNS